MLDINELMNWYEADERTRRLLAQDRRFDVGLYFSYEARNGVRPDGYLTMSEDENALFFIPVPPVGDVRFVLYLGEPQFVPMETGV
jgi:hypothetical protein